MKIVHYWKEVRLAAPFKKTFMLVPRQKIREDAPDFDAIFEAIKASDLNYEVLERDQKVVESRK